MSPVPDVVVELVERFRHNRNYYHRPDYNETQVRREFIDPLFEALGWDVANKRGVAPQYQEVIHEASVRMRGSVHAPDYCFRVGPQPKFFVEAKKPAVDIRADIHPAYQLRRYAWSAKLPLSVLTDFEEFSVYDCRIRPDPGDKAGVARILYLNYEEYPDRWEEIATLFSREAVWRGDFDRYAESTRQKRGTLEVDDAFLAEIEGWRELLARNLALRNPTLNRRDLNYAVQKIIDRIIFLRICEDRGIEPYEGLRDTLSGGHVYERLLERFRRADARYNSGLFHFSEERGRNEPPDTLTPTLRVDDKVLAQIIGGLYYPESPYEFSVISHDILGNVYERFLGSVIRLTPGHRAVVEQKPEVRKAGGVYYTPKYIVDYIVEHTVGELVKGKAPGQIANLRILDPACGSGSFLLGAYDYLLRYHLDWYVNHPARRPRKEIYQTAGGEWRLTIAEKKRILLNNIYGVDIDPQAVEVTKLSLLLKVLEGETEATLQPELLPERALPDLANNIKCGNSLIGSDFYEGQQLALLDEEEMWRVNPFDWENEFAEIMGAGGFDAVIGNPPYIRIQNLKEFAPKEVEFYKGRYVAASKGNYDIYVVFVERGLQLLNAKGRLGFILPHKFFNAQYGEPLRKLLTEGRHLVEVVHFGDQQVFAGATTYTCLLFLDKAGSEGCHVQKVSDLSVWQSHRQAVAGRVPAERITEKEWNFVVGPGADLFHRLSEMPIKLGDVAERIAQGIRTSANEVYVLDLVREEGQTLLARSKVLGRNVTLEKAVILKFLLGREIKRYTILPSGKVVIVPYRD
ncbi:MAG: Eco57I restriction-modification methylase domain-containing protein, partial [Chloroflexi bacterium]|nr:Eco57I restriction-modification methylase domain-containing protein [Chloroflexota bacterium]